MQRLRVKPEVKDAELLKYGFKQNRRIRHPDYIRDYNGTPLYRVYFTDKHRNLQIQLANDCVIASSLQLLIYTLTKDGLLEAVEDTEEHHA